MPAAEEPRSCETYQRAIELIGRKWSGAIIFVMLRGAKRFREIRRGVPDITDRVLSERLSELEGEGILLRSVVPETPVRIEYALTKKGRSLAGIVDAVGKWAHEWGAAESGRPTRRRRA